RIMMFLESVWFVIHSFFYVGHINFLLIICVFIVISIKLYTYVFVERDYYPNYSLDVRPYEDRRLRVSMVTNNYLPFIGGVPISIARLRQGLEQLEHRVQIIAPAYPGVKQSREGIVRIPSFASIGENGQFRLANIFSRGITRALKEFQPDLVHLHHPVWLGWIGLIRARMLRLPTVFTYHTRLEHYAHFVPLPGPLFRNLISHAAIRGFANRCTGVIVPTDSASEYLRMIGVTSPVYVHPTGIDITSIRKTDPDRSSQLRRSHGIGGDQRVLVSVSRLSKEKNIYFLIDAMEKLRGLMGDSFHLLIIGTGDEQDRLQQRINDLDLADRITLVGAVPPDEVWDYYQLSDVFVFASKSETQGMVILEAMAAGLPVVAVRSSGIEDAVKDQVTGFKTQERLEHWVHAVHRLLTDAGLYQVMSTQAVAFAEQHSIERFAQNVADTYREILALHNQHPGL
ncbi:MAG: glycosyltransferase, partial [Spirochaeta sp.]